MFINNYEIKSKKFIDDFNINYISKIKTELETIGKKFLRKNHCHKKIIINFVEKENFGIVASVKNNIIEINKTRLEILYNLKINDLDEKHLENLYNFYKKNKKNNKLNQNEYVFYKFIERYIKMGAEKYFGQIGSYKTISFDLLMCVFHECQHIIQDNCKRYIVKPNLFGKFSNDITLLFITTFNEMYEFVKSKNISFSYERDNATFPIEFDARYKAIILSNYLQKNYYKKDKLYKSYIKQNTIMFKFLDIKYEVNKMWEKFEELYLLCEQNENDKYEAVYQMLIRNKKCIIKTLNQRYKLLQKI